MHLVQQSCFALAQHRVSLQEPGLSSAWQNMHQTATLALSGVHREVQLIKPAADACRVFSPDTAASPAEKLLLV